MIMLLACWLNFARFVFLKDKVMFFLRKELLPRIIPALFSLWLATACQGPQPAGENLREAPENTLARMDDEPPARLPEAEEPVHPLEAAMEAAGLADVQALDPTIQVELKYSTTDNFMGKDMYQGMQRAFLQPEVAVMLVSAQAYLRQLQPGFSLIVYDAARPRSVQQKMWDALDIPFQEKVKFLSNPANGSIHNFGAAVDVSIVDHHGTPLDMGTPFDYMGEPAYPRLEQQMLEAGVLTTRQLENRKLLRRVMRHAGFFGIQTEWWHFNAMTRDEARQRYEIIE
jgi:zinc D-Ala-D-Ala dipeptidase